VTQRTIKDRSASPFVQIDIRLITALTNAEFKIYAQIKRRAGHDGECWQSLEHMAKETGNSTGTLKRALKALFAKGLIEKTKRPGGTDLYELTPPSQWKLDHNDLPNIDHFDLGLDHFDRGVDQNDLPNIDQNDPLIRSHLELDPIKKRREEREAPRSPLPHQRFVEAQFVVEKTPWMKAGDLNSIDPGFVKFVQDELKGLGAYEKKDPTEANAKDHIRRYMRVPRGTEERQVLHAAIFDKWTAYKKHGNKLDETEIDYELLQEKGRLNWTDELPMQWSERFGKGIYYAAQLTARQKLEYLNWLRTQEADPVPEVTHYAA